MKSTNQRLLKKHLLSFTQAKLFFNEKIHFMKFSRYQGGGGLCIQHVFNKEGYWKITQNNTRGEGGVQNGPKIQHVFFEWPLMTNHFRKISISKIWKVPQLVKMKYRQRKQNRVLILSNIIFKCFKYEYDLKIWNVKINKTSIKGTS